MADADSRLLGAAALLIALLALGLVGYTAGKVSELSKRQEDVSKRLGEVSSNLTRISQYLEGIQGAQNQSLATIQSQLSALSATLDELSARVSSLEANQTGQAESLAGVLETINELKAGIQQLQQALASQAVNLTQAEERVAELASRIDQLYQLLLFPVTVTDASGEPVTIPARPTRIVSLFPSVTEILWAVNASGQVVAVDSYSDYPPEVQQLRENGTLADIGSGWFPSLERILAVRPDLVIGLDSVTSNHQLKEELSHYGIPMILLPDATFGDVLRSIILVGQATGHPAEAAALAAELSQNATAIRSYIESYLNQTGEPRESVALIVWVNPLYIAGSGTFENDIITLAGGVNAYSNVTGWQAVSPESLLEANPDVILITAGHGQLNMTRQQFIDYLHDLLGDAAYNITAVSTGRIYFLNYEYNDVMVRPSPRVIEAVYLTSIVLYPQAYGITQDQIPEYLEPDTFPLPQPPWQQAG